MDKEEILQEIEKTKKHLINMEKMLKEDIERWKSNFNGKVSAIEELLQQLDQLKAKNIKIYKTLTEIKEIAGKDFRHTAWEEYAKQLKQILQKISEVNNDR